MAQMIGSDPDQLDALGNQMSRSADRLDSIRGEIGSLLSHSHWVGRDADDFRGQWQHRLSGLLTAASHATRDGASAIRTNAAQQRAASSTDGAGALSLGAFASIAGSGDGAEFAWNFVDLYQAAGGQLNLMSGISGVSASLAYIASGKMAGPIGRALAEKINALPQALKTVFVKDAPNLGGFTKIADGAGKAFGYLGLGVDAFELGGNLAKDPTSAETLRSGVDVVFDGAEILSAECPPLSLGIFAAHQLVDFTWDYLDEHPEVGKAIVDGASNVAKHVADAGGALMDGSAHLGGEAAGAAKNLFDGGVNAIKRLF